MEDKCAVDACMYLEDSPSNIAALKKAGKNVLIFSNSTNRKIEGKRANTWDDVASLVVAELGKWKESKAIEPGTQNHQAKPTGLIVQ